MKYHLPTFAVAMIVVAALLWAVALWYNVSYPLVQVEQRGPYTLVYPSGEQLVGVFFFSNAVTRLKFTGNCSATAYIKYTGGQIYNLTFRYIELASNVTSLDMTFVAHELGVPKEQDTFGLTFVPATQPAKIIVTVTTGYPNSFHYVFVVFGLWFAALGVGQIIYEFLKTRKQP